MTPHRYLAELPSLEAFQLDATVLNEVRRWNAELNDADLQTIQRASYVEGKLSAEVLRTKVALWHAAKTSSR